MNNWPDGVPCDHSGCLSHVNQPCEGCGRFGGKTIDYAKLLIRCMEKWLCKDGVGWSGSSDKTLNDYERCAVKYIYDELKGQ